MWQIYFRSDKFPIPRETNLCRSGNTERRSTGPTYLQLDDPGNRAAGRPDDSYGAIIAAFDVRDVKLKTWVLDLAYVNLRSAEKLMRIESLNPLLGIKYLVLEARSTATGVAWRYFGSHLRPCHPSRRCQSHGESPADLSSWWLSLRWAPAGWAAARWETWADSRRWFAAAAVAIAAIAVASYRKWSACPAWPSRSPDWTPGTYDRSDVVPRRCYRTV